MYRFLTLLLLSSFSFIAYSQTCDLELEGFENGGGFPPGFTVAGCYTNGTTTPNTGTYHAGFNTENDALISPTYSNPSEICYYWRTSGVSSDFNIDVQWSDDGGSIWNTFETLNVQDTANRTTYRQNCLSLCGLVFTDPSSVQFRFLQYNRVGGSWYLDDICVSSGTCSITPTKLEFSSIPAGCTNINTDFSVEVCAYDASNNLDNTYTDNITISKNTGSGTLSGTLTQSAVAGCATFSDLQFDLQDNYTLTASDGSLIDGTSSAIEIQTSCPLVDTLTIVTYNLLNFPNSRVGCTNYVSNREDTLKKIMKYLNPDVLMVCELQDAAGADLILNSSLNVDGETKYAKANFVLNTSSGATDLNNMFYYNTDKLTLKKQDQVKTDLRDVGEYIVYGNDPNLSTHEDTTFIDFYETHLKAGSAASDELRREEEADSIRKYIDLKPAGRNNIIGGDFNFYSDTENAYQTLCYSGTYPFVDPIAREGAWNNNGAFADVHSQSTRAFSPDYDCGSFGGTDDRFDFLLTSSNVISGTNRVSFIPGSYSALGNDGSIFNGSINDASNTSGVPDSILNALFYMSDHLPIVMKVQIEYPNTGLSIKSEKKKEQKTSNEEDITIKVYPNPVTDKLHIKVNSKEEINYGLKLYSSLGNLVLEKQIIRPIETLELEKIHKGIYILELINNDSVIKKEKIAKY